MSRFLLYTAALLSLIPLTGAPAPEWNESFENGMKVGYAAAMNKKGKKKSPR